MRSAGLISLVLCFACQTERSDREPPAMAPQLSGTLPKHMRNCPSAVPSAHTVATPTPDGVDVAISSDNAVARRRILELARLHSGFREPIWGMPPHTGMHGGPGTIGRCPIIHAKTTVSYDETARGVVIHVQAVEPAMVRRLQQITELRVESLAPSSS